MGRSRSMKISILVSVLTRAPWKKMNSPPWFALLRDFQNQEYRFTFLKSRTRLVEKEKKKGKKKNNTCNCKALSVSHKRKTCCKPTALMYQVFISKSKNPTLNKSICYLYITSWTLDLYEFKKNFTCSVLLLFQVYHQ